MVRILEYIIFGALVAANLSFGLYYSFTKRVSTSGVAATRVEVFLGNRALKMLPLAASSVASLCSSTGLIGFPAHYYAYGWHVMWCGFNPLLYFPLATHLFVPLLYELRVTSIFEYLRLRFNRAISLTACAIYIFLTQSVAAISIFAASLTLVTVFNAPLFWSNIVIGISGTLYTALGGLRGVVWTDCMQFLVILIAPTAFVANILADTFSRNSSVKPLSDLNLEEYIGDFSLDLTSDENVWACFWGASAFSIYRMCLDEMVTQRFLASRTLQAAKRTAVASLVLLSASYVFCMSMGAALTIWYRGCDPGLQGAITSIDQDILVRATTQRQDMLREICERVTLRVNLSLRRVAYEIVPYYLSTELIRIPGLVGMFLAGVVCAATRQLAPGEWYSCRNKNFQENYYNVRSRPFSGIASLNTVSSTINSQATILYVDIIAHGYSKADEHVLLITRCTALFLGLILTVYSTLVVYMGSVTRIFLMVYSAITAPYVGLCLLAALFPFVHSKGAGGATLITAVYQMWHIADIFTSGRTPPRAPVSLDYCPGNTTTVFSPATTAVTAPDTRSDSTFFLFRLSHLWSSFFCIFATVVIAVLISVLTGEVNIQKNQRGICSDALVRLWRKSKLVCCNHVNKNAEKKDESDHAEFGTLMIEERSSNL